MVGHRSEPLVSACRVERGLYALRYVEAPEFPCPVADVTMRAGDLEIVSAPGRDSAALHKPGQCLIILARSPGEFEIRVLAQAGGGTDAKFNLELLDAGEASQGGVVDISTTAAMRLHRSAAQPSGRTVSDVAVFAHISRRGDVRVGADEWVAGPDEVLPIEGLAITTGRPGLAVRIRVQTLNTGHQWSKWHDGEEFAGSRQQADPLTGIALALNGEDVDHYEIAAEVMALGSPRQAKSGQVIEFFGIDPIVGFRFRLNSATRPSITHRAAVEMPLRVFRAKK